MNLKSLRAFIHVMDEGALTAAADKMNLSQPAVSRLIQLLEDEFCVQLFYRDRKSLQPTPEAEKFYSEAYRVVSAIDEFPAVFSQITSRSDFPLRIICHPRMVNGLVVPAIALLSEKRPDIRVRLDVHPRRELGRRIVTDGFDVGVFTVPIQVEQVTLAARRTTKLQVLLAKDHRLAHRPFLTIDDLNDEAYIALNRELVIRQSIDRSLMKQGDVLKVEHEVSVTTAAHRMAVSGMGFTLTDALVLENEFLDVGTLVPLRPDVNIDAGFYLPKDRAEDARAIEFIACLNDICDQKLEQSGAN